ncbi:hypothetical protein NDU88_003793 [Pleurodeles waltl]|uniref:ribonuclease H n=1 Tax=Pleurodeles waltl TaxID=8319 RepID=A0AAV7M4H9_PLEWA|nr:hypothetical protein NDU88_003793 [Pleurodeles waltl]
MSQNNTVQQFPLRGENGINNEWSDESSDSEECRLAASLKVDQKGPYIQGKVMGHKVSFLVDTGATRSTVSSAEVPKLPLSGRTVKVVGVANQLLTNPITDPVQVELGTFQGLHRFVVWDSSPVSLLGRDLLCKTRCSITCSNEGIEVQTNRDDEGDEEQVSEPETETTDKEYPLINFFPMFTVTDLPADLQGTVQKKVPQYHMAQDVLMKVAQLISDFVKQGVLKEVISSPCNSPIMGLRKPCEKVRIVQDLRKINDIVVKCCPVVQNPAVIMFQVPCDAEWFTVVDLSQAFFSITLHEDSQFLISFKLLDKVYNWCRIPQGFLESPSIFNHILKKDLESLELPFQSTLVQYIDDLLRDECKYDLIALLNHLGKNGHKVSSKKLQYCQKEVHGGGDRPVAYFSATLDPVAAALAGCLRAVAAVGLSLTQCEGIAMGHHLTVKATTLTPISDPGHNLKAGDWVVIKKHIRKSCLEPRWKVPYQVILTTTTAVKCVGIPNWIHASHTKKVTCPTDEEVEFLKVPTTKKEVSGLESDRKGTETEGEPVEDSLVTPVRDEGEETQRGDGEPISTEAPGEPNQREVLPEADEYGNELEPLTDCEKVASF